MTAPNCPYCGQVSELVTGDVLYRGRDDLADKFFYRCARCDASVGCHPKTKASLGTLANKALRNLRQQAHRAFDQLWTKNGKYQVFNNRADAYDWLAFSLGKEEVHIGSSDNAQCSLIIGLAEGVITRFALEGGNRQAVELWMADMLEHQERAEQAIAQEKAQVAIVAAEAQRAKFASDTRWGSW